MKIKNYAMFIGIAIILIVLIVFIINSPISNTVFQTMPSAISPSGSGFGGMS